jgi:D-serine deaminase-like pyridoxal phosphate-dependent protein
VKLADLSTPALVLDEGILKRNCTRMRERASALGVRLRPHLKTAKAAGVARYATGPGGPITVSTLAEARYFLDRGFADLTYAVGMVPARAAAVDDLRERGARIQVILDDAEVAREVASALEPGLGRLDVLIEIDTGGGRAGIPATDLDRVVAAGRAIDDASTLALGGVLTHAGQSYAARSRDALAVIAHAERDLVVRAAASLRDADLPVETVSVGSTPTMMVVDDLTGVTEIRPGVYTFFDLFQHGLGVCAREDIAISVLTTVIGHHADHVLIDAGTLALSADRSCAALGWNIGAGIVVDELGRPTDPELVVTTTHQEHGIVRAARVPSGEPIDRWERPPIGTRLRVLPHHACMTAAPYSRYHVVNGDDGVVDQWDAATGWE